MYSMKELIDAALRSCNFDETLTKESVEKAYRDVVGEFISKLTRSVSYNTKNHTLFVELASAALKQEISYKCSDLCDAINRQLGKDEVKTLKLC